MLRTFKIALFSATMMLAACSKADKPAPTGPDEVKPADPAAKPADPAAPTAAAPAGGGANTELENKGIAMMQKMGDIFAADAQDCEKLATDIRAFIAQNKELLAQLTAMEKKETDQEKAAFETRNKGVQEAVMQKMGPAMQACHDNKNVEAAMKEFPAD